MHRLRGASPSPLQAQRIKRSKNLNSVSGESHAKTQRYRDDLKAKSSHADSRVYNDGFKMFYTVHQVESALVWKKLAHLASCPVQ